MSLSLSTESLRVCMHFSSPIAFVGPHSLWSPVHLDDPSVGALGSAECNGQRHKQQSH